MIRRVIFLDVPPADFVLATRAATWLLNQDLSQKDCILGYGEAHKSTKHFYVKRNKASITVRPCGLNSNGCEGILSDDG